MEALRIFCPEATFIFTSTNKVYGDRPNFLPLIEKNKPKGLLPDFILLITLFDLVYSEILLLPGLLIKTILLFLYFPQVIQNSY